MDKYILEQFEQQRHRKQNGSQQEKKNKESHSISKTYKQKQEMTKGSPKKENPEK